MKTKFFFLTSVLLVFGVLLSACGPTTVYAQPPQQRTITVTGTGTITLTPDIAYITIGVHTQDASATAAMNKNNVQTQAVITAIKSFSVDEKDIKTINFSVYQQPVYDNNNNQIGTNYVVDNSVYVTIRDLTKLGSLLDASVNAGANNINSIQFDLADKTAALSQARLAAVQDARRQADELVSATDVKLGDVQTISYYDSTPPVYTPYARAMDSASASVPVQSGSMEITTTVTIVYGLK